MRRYGRRYNFKATITDRRTGEILDYTQDTLDEFKEGLEQRGIKGQRLTAPAKSHPKHITLSVVEKKWLGMTVDTHLGHGEVVSLGPLRMTLWVILDDPNALAIHYQHEGSTDRMVCLRVDQCRGVSSWRRRAESLPL